MPEIKFKYVIVQNKNITILGDLGFQMIVHETNSNVNKGWV